MRSVERLKVSGQSIRILPLLSRLAGALPGGVAYLDRHLVFTFCNDVQAGYFGRSPEAIIGQRLHDVAPDNPHFREEIERVVANGERSPQTALSATWADRPEHGEHHYLMSYKADLTPAGRVRGIFLTTFDVTRSVLHDRDDDSLLRERIKTLELMVTERETLVGIISHELRTPLTTIFGNAHMLLRRLEDLDGDSRSRVINDIREEAERMNRLVENMLLLARAGAQKEVATEPVPLKELLSDVVAGHQKRFDHRVAFVSVKPRSLQADGRPDYVKQVVENLLGNAEKYSPEDRPIDVRACRTGDEVIISVLDRGPGVLPAESEIVFQAFYRSDRTATKVSGAGIGLAVCKLLVQAQSGRIWVSPRRGGGSVFSFTLPAAT